MSHRLVCGWGINDAAYAVYSPRDSDGRRYKCLIYGCWGDMIRRCYSSKFQSINPTYVGCWVDEHWRSFMVFRAWYLEQTPKPGDQLDKDFLGDGKLYSPENCCFVPSWLNKLFNDHGALRGDLPQGVHYNKQFRKYEVYLSCKGRRIYLGYFDTPREASEVYLKATYVEELLVEFPQPQRLAAAVRCKMTELIEQEAVAA